MKFADTIIRELSKYGIIPAGASIQSVSFFPPAPYDHFDCSVRITKITKEQLCVEDKGKLIKNVEYIGNYINLSFFPDEFLKTVICFLIQNNFTDTKEYIGKNIAIEHTSITPVYPINLATFRSSVLGEALKNLFEKLGANVSTHFFVEDLARQLDLLKAGVCASKPNVLLVTKGQKVDHIIGRIFTTAYVQTHQQCPAAQKMDGMFPMSGDVSMTMLGDVRESTTKSISSKELCDVCLSGIKQTLNRTGIQMDYFDYESDHTYNFDPSFFKDPQMLHALIDNSQKVPYYLRNCAYFSNMLKQYDMFFTVISDRQRATINDTLDALSNTKGINAVFFGDVLISDDDERNSLDSIKEGTFHSVDQYIDVMSSWYEQTDETIIRALKLKILAVKSGKGCYIDDSACNQYTDYFKLLDFYDRLKAKKYSEICDVSLIDTMTFCKHIIQLNDIIAKTISERSFHYLVEFAFVLYHDLEGNDCCSVNTASVNKISFFEAVEKTFDLIFSILDVSR